MAGSLKKLTKKSQTCKICKSPYADMINDFIREGQKVPDIMVWINDRKEPPLDIHESSLRRHAKNHMHFDPKLVNLDVGAEPPPLTTEQAIALSEFLDLIISKVQSKIVDNKLDPTIQEALKAAEIKAKIKEESKVEKELLKFIMDVAGTRGYSNQA